MGQLILVNEKINYNRMKLKYVFILLVFVIFVSCQDDDKKDTEKPIINAAYTQAFPSHCDVIYFGESFNLKAFFTDNTELGAYSIDIHNNFDHHSHGHKIEECNLAPVKTPENPYRFLESFELPEGISEYQLDKEFIIPAGNDKGLFDEGDYHFQIFLTDKEGWSTPLGLSIKMMHRK